MIKVILDHALDQSKLNKYMPKVQAIHKMIHEKTGLGNDFLGWVTYPDDFDKNEYETMKKVATKFQKNIDYLVVIGIGGSYLGSRAAIDMINGQYNVNQKVQICYAGHTMSSNYTSQLLDFLKGKKFGICMISKSGTTTEPAIAFRLFKKLLISQIGEAKAKELIVAVTDGSKGDLRKSAMENGYQTFRMPDDIGGRYSVLTPVGIFPMLVAGVDTDAVLAGAKQAATDLKKEHNSAYDYALARYFLYKEGKYTTELLTSYESQMEYFNEWWKQLFGESEGKDGKALFPASASFCGDLHVLGQYIQEGPRFFFETVLKFTNLKDDVKLFKTKDDLDGLNHMSNLSLKQINDKFLQAAVKAHSEIAKVPNIIIEIPSLDAKTFGYLAYWFFIACAMSAYLIEVNPFNQPGVEVYKKIMFRLLGKK